MSRSSQIILGIGLISVLVMFIIMMFAASQLTSNKQDYAMLLSAMFVPMGIMYIATVLIIGFTEVVKAIKGGSASV